MGNQGTAENRSRSLPLADQEVHIAIIVRGADTAKLDLAPEAAGLLAISLVLSRCFTNDHEQIKHGFIVYDALYAWAREARDEKHTWNPQRVA